MKPVQGAPLRAHNMGAPASGAGATPPRVPRPLHPVPRERGAGAKPGGAVANVWGRTHGHEREEAVSG